MRFHNAIVRLVGAQGVPRAKLFETARRIVVQHYQSIVLNELLPAIVRPSVYKRVRKYGPSFFRVGSEEDLFLPDEFAGAAFRTGHSMVRNTRDEGAGVGRG